MFYPTETTSHHSSLFVFRHSPWVRWESERRQAGEIKCPMMILHPENIRVFTSVLCREMLHRQYEVRRKIFKWSNKANKIKILLKDWLNNNLLLRNICIWLLCDIKSFPIIRVFSTNFENTSLSFKMTYALQNRLNYGIDLKVQRSGVLVMI